MFFRSRLAASVAAAAVVVLFGVCLFLGCVRAQQRCAQRREHDHTSTQRSACKRIGRRGNNNTLAVQAFPSRSTHLAVARAHGNAAAAEADEDGRTLRTRPVVDCVVARGEEAAFCKLERVGRRIARPPSRAHTQHMQATRSHLADACAGASAGAWSADIVCWRARAPWLSGCGCRRATRDAGAFCFFVWRAGEQQSAAALR